MAEYRITKIDATFSSDAAPKEATLYAEYITGYRTVNETIHKVYALYDKSWQVTSIDKMTKETKTKYFRDKTACWRYILATYGDDVMVVRS